MIIKNGRRKQVNKRPSIYVGASLEALITELKNESEGVSSIINDIADKYKILVEQCKPDLTRDEWLSLCAAYNGHMFGTGDMMLHELRSMHWMISEWAKYNEPEAAQFDHSKLVEKLEDMGLTEKIAILHNVKRFWASNDIEMFDQGE